MSIQSYLVPAKFDEKYSVVEVKKGESSRLRCNVSGDQPIKLEWTKDGHQMDKIGGEK